MDHWFDRLAQPHARRTTLKAGALAAAMLILPTGRVPKAWATERDPCFKPCTDAATKEFSNTKNVACKAAGGVTIFNGILFGAQPLGFVLTYTGLVGFTDCLASAELQWHRAFNSCRGSECGDPSKYPGGQAPRPPPPDCTPGRQFLCGDHCCDVSSECCPCSSAEGGYICCASGVNCDCCT